MIKPEKFKDEIKADNKLNSELDKTIKARVKASNKLVNRADSFIKVIDKEKEKINDVGVKAFRIARDLGVDPNNIKGYTESEKLENDLMGNRDLINLFKAFDWV